MARGKGRTLAVKVETDVKGTAKLGSAAKEFANLDNIARGASERIGHQLVDAAARAGAAVTEFIGGSIEAASQLQQSTGAVESVFGEAGAAVEKFADRSAQAFGLSKRQVKEFGALLGAQLQSFGFEAGESAKMAVELQQRAADMAATFGGTVPDAVQAISSLMRGERNPIERYGVALKQADINARILAKGLDVSTTEAEKQSTAIASLELLYEQTAKTQGQFARESDTLAGQQARWAASLEDSQAALGEKLMPAVVAFFEFLNGTGIPVLMELIDGFGKVVGVVGTVRGATSGFATGIREGLQDARSGLHDWIADISGGAITLGASADTAATKFSQLSDAGKLAAEEAASSFDTFTATARMGMEAAGEEVTTGVDAMATYMGSLPEKGADELLANQFRLGDAIDELNKFMEQALDPAQEIFEAQMFLASEAAAKGVESGNPLVVAKTQEMINDANAVLSNTGAAFGYGQAWSSSFAFGISESAWKAQSAAAGVAQSIRAIMPSSEPKDPSSPFRGITRAFGMMDTLAAGIRGSSRVVQDAMRGALAFDTPQLALGTAGAGLGAATGLTAPSGDVHYHTHYELTLEGEPPRGTTEDRVRKLLGRMASSWG